MHTVWTVTTRHTRLAHLAARSAGLEEWAETEEGRRSLIDLIALPQTILRRSSKPTRRPNPPLVVDI